MPSFFITPEELTKLKNQRVVNLVDSALSEFQEILVHRNPDEDGYYSVSLSGLAPFTKDEIQLAGTLIEAALKNQGWEVVPCGGIFGYKLRPENK